MALVSLLYSSVTWSIALLDPYSILRTRSVAAHHALFQVNLSKPSVQIAYQSLRLKRNALLAASVSVLLVPLLAITTNGLFLFHRTQQTLVIGLADHISISGGQDFNNTAWSRASLWVTDQLNRNHSSYPSGTYKHFVLPKLGQYAARLDAYSGASVLEDSAVNVDVDVMMSNITCKLMDQAGFRYTVGSNRSNDTYIGQGYDYNGDYLNFTHIDLAGYKCESPGAHCDTGIMSIGTPLESDVGNLVYEDDGATGFWADPSAWPDSDALRGAIAARDEMDVSPFVFLFHGTWEKPVAHVSGIACESDIRQGRANVTYDSLKHTVTSVQLYQEGLASISNSSQATSWLGSPNSTRLLPNGDLWQTILNNHPLSFYDTPSGVAQLAAQASDFYNVMFTQYCNLAHRDQNFTVNTTHAVATLLSDDLLRISQAPIPTIVLQILLVAIWLCSCIVYYLFDTKTLLPKNPCSIAAQASLLADSKFLDMIPEEAANATWES